jgi:hypothetical protein
VNVQVESFGEFGSKAFVNIGVSPNALETREFPREYETHLRIRACQLYDDPQLVRAFMQEPSDAPLLSGADERLTVLLDKICDFVEHVSSVEGIRSCVGRSPFLATLKLRQYLDEAGGRESG